MTSQEQCIGYTCKIYSNIANGSPTFHVLVDGGRNQVHLYSAIDLENWYMLREGDFDEYKEVTEADLDHIPELAVFDVERVFIGESYLNEMTKFSGANDDPCTGNSILLLVHSDPINKKYTYVVVYFDVYQFETDEPIHTYISSVGNSSVPYPYAESDHWCYSICEESKTPVEQHPNRLARGYIDYVDGATYEPFDTKELFPCPF